MVLTKRITSVDDMKQWIVCAAYAEIMNFVEGVNLSVRAKRINDKFVSSKNILKLVTLLKRLYDQIDRTPLELNPQRYGNKAFRDYYQWLCDSSQLLCVEHLGLEADSDGICEVSTYLNESIGNAVRIDYGTGHELAFLAFIVGLFKLNFLEKPELTEIRRPSPKSTDLNDYASVALIVLPMYLRLVRHLQTYFRMEPAGSHGAWSIDDFQFIPYLWGSAQLIGMGLYEPSDIPSKEIADKEKDAFLFFSCINYIYQVKSGPFAEHSSCLQSLTGVPHWEKVNSGMIKMFKAEVLGKFPIVQHFLFGDLLTFEAAPPGIMGIGRPGFPGPSRVMPPPTFAPKQGLPNFNRHAGAQQQ